MQIEKLNENKIKIILNLQDLQEKNIDLHSFMSTSIESQALFYDMLDIAEKEIGFYTKDYKLIIEVIAIPEGSFILTITRFLPEKKDFKKLKRKNIKLKNSSYIYVFNTFDDYLEFCTYIEKQSTNNIFDKLTHSSLYQYNSKYYLCITNTNLDIFKQLHCSIIEFGTSIANSNLFERKLIEYGKAIFKTNAISECVKSFL